MGEDERGQMMAQVPTASIGQSTRGSASETSMQISYNHLGYSQEEAPLSHICACKWNSFGEYFWALDSIACSGFGDGPANIALRNFCASLGS